MLPVEPNDEIDQEFGGLNYPDGDETQTNDGWAAFSGTSAAAPQLAGTCALMKQAWPQMTPVQAKDILKTTARDVTKGRASPSTGHHRAGPAPLRNGVRDRRCDEGDAAGEVQGGRGPTFLPAPAPRVPAGDSGGMEELVLSLALPERDEM
jgi:subtilisin family serine protease